MTAFKNSQLIMWKYIRVPFESICISFFEIKVNESRQMRCGVTLHFRKRKEKKKILQEKNNATRKEKEYLHFLIMKHE